MPDTHWLQEILIGYAVSGIPAIEKVYVHKKIQFVEPNKGPIAGIESDVTIVTNDKKLVLIEVTTQTSLDNIMEDVDKKIKNMNERKIPYHSVGFITSANVIDGFLTYSKSQNVKIFSPSNLYNLTEFVKRELLD